MGLKRQDAKAHGRAKGSVSMREPENKEGPPNMNHQEIIFFDELGFGWVVDKAIINMIHANSSHEEIIIERTLADLLRRA